MTGTVGTIGAEAQAEETMAIVTATSALRLTVRIGRDDSMHEKPTEAPIVGCPRSAGLSPPLSFRYIAVEGRIGVGKTALAERLGARLDATAVLEESENPFLADFYNARAGAALQAQLFYLLNRHRQQLTLHQGDLFAQSTVSDYLFDKDKIYAYLNLDDNELFIYQRLYDLLVTDVPSPDLVVYLQAPTEVLVRRLRDRAREVEAESIDPDD